MQGGSNANAATQDGCTALHYATKMGHKDIVDELLKAGSDINATTKANNWTSLYYAAHKGYKDIIQILLQKNSNHNIENISICTALNLAIQYNHGDCITLLKSILEERGGLLLTPQAC